MGLLALPLCAQEQEDHVVRRGRHKAAVVAVVEKETVQKHWFSNVSVGVAGGTYTGVTCNTDFKPSAITSSNNTVTLSGHTATLGANKSEAVFSASYELLYRAKTFYIGPGVTLLSGKNFSPGVYLRARYEFGPWDYRPYISVAGGIHYMSGGNFYYDNYYDVRYHKLPYSTKYYNCGFSNKNDEVSLSGGIKPYADFGVGIAISLSDNVSMTLGYRTMLRPSANISFDINKYSGTIENYVSTHNTYGVSAEQEWSFPVESEETLRLYHGVNLSIQF